MSVDKTSRPARPGQPGQPRGNPVRVLWLLGNDCPKADTISLVRWARAADRADRTRLALTVGFLDDASGKPGPAGEMVAADGSPLTIPAALRECGAEVVYWPGASFLRPASLRRAADRVVRAQIDVVVSVYLRADLFAARLRRRTAAAWVVRAAGIGSFRRTRLYAGDWFDRRAYAGADRFLAISDAVRQDWSARLRRPAGDFHVIHNPAPAALAALTADLPARDEIRRRLGVEAGEQLVLAVGRLDREKGIELLVEAAAMIHRRAAASLAKTQADSQFHGLRWVVLGDGPRRAQLQRQIDRLGLARRFLLAGDRNDVWSHLAAADLFVLPSRMEGCPNALLEAASGGVPIVAMNVGAVAELVTDGQHALLADPSAGPGGPSGLVGAISRLLLDRPLADRLAKAARARMAAEFAPAIIAEKHVALFEQMAGGR